MIRTSTLLHSLALGALVASVAAGVGTLDAATAPVPGTPHAAKAMTDVYHGDYTDGSLAAWSCAHGEQPSGYARGDVPLDVDACALRSGDVRPVGDAIRPANFACWVELKGDPADAEGICGDKGDRPRTGTVDLGAEVTVGGHVWVATVSGLEPVSYT